MDIRHNPLRPLRRSVNWIFSLRKRLPWANRNCLQTNKSSQRSRRWPAPWIGPAYLAIYINPIGQIPAVHKNLHFTLLDQCVTGTHAFSHTFSVSAHLAQNLQIAHRLSSAIQCVFVQEAANLLRVIHWKSTSQSDSDYRPVSWKVRLYVQLCSKMLRSSWQSTGLNCRRFRVTVPLPLALVAIESDLKIATTCLATLPAIHWNHFPLERFQ